MLAPIPLPFVDPALARSTTSGGGGAGFDDQPVEHVQVAGVGSYHLLPLGFGEANPTLS
jgi:hypothetical protein